MHRRVDAPPTRGVGLISATINAVAVLPKEMCKASTKAKDGHGGTQNALVRPRVARGLQPKHSRVGVYRHAGEPFSVLILDTTFYNFLLFFSHNKKL